MFSSGSIMERLTPEGVLREYSPMKHSPLLLCLCLVLPITSHAIITLTIDSGAETLTFTGSDTGNSFDPSPGFGVAEIVTWQFGPGSGTNESVNIASGFSESFNDQTNLQVIDGSSSDGIRLILSNSGSPAAPFTDLTATGTPISYAGLSAPFRAILSSIPSGTMALDQGTGYSSVTINAIPEPSAVTLIVVAGLLLNVYRRK